ncbi:MAG: aminotransferase class V-fold PLP-dependent enzyme [Clostridia bacterium]|nr:aminotransferase class V-fold PLP-dependent enzyme [Clostridia bacterium]
MTQIGTGNYAGIYADWAATSPLHPAARASLLEWLDCPVPANPSSLHAFGMAASDRLAAARVSLAASFGWDGEITFTSGGTESDGLAVHGLVQRFRGTDRRRIVLSPLEHPAIREAVYAFGPSAGFAVEECAVRTDGAVDPVDFAARMGEDLAFCAVMAVQNETGVMQPVEDLAALAHGCGALFLSDAVQAAGHTAIPVSADMVTVSAHKFGGPAGVGAVLHRGELSPLLKGGGQERGRRGGTENVAGICAMAAAAAAVSEPDWMAGLRDELEDAFLCRMREAGVMVSVAGRQQYGGAEAHRHRIGSVSCFVFGGSGGSVGLTGSGFPTGENLVLSCDMAGLAVSSGSACHSGTGAPSAALLAMGYSPAEAVRSVRLSFGWGTDPEQMRRAYAILGDVVVKMVCPRNL